MFDDPTLVGDWSALVARLHADGVVAGWLRSVPELADVADLDDLLAGWADPIRTHQIAAGLVRLAAADGARDDDALLLLLHLLSGVVARLGFQLADLSPDITAIVLSELTCQIRSYPWQTRTGGLVANLEKETRRAVLADLRPTDRYHPDRVERLFASGVVYPDHRLAFTEPADPEDLDVVDLLLWAAAAGVRSDDLRLLIETERDRGHFLATAPQAWGITSRQVQRRRERALNALRDLAPAYLAAVA